MSMDAMRSSASPPRTRIPSRAARPVATITAVGTASPIAHGQAMISTATLTAAALASSCPLNIHTAKVSAAMPNTAGTNTALTRSANRCIGAFSPWAARSSRRTCSSIVSAPSAVMRALSSPWRLVVPPISRAPVSLSTGTGSPVSIDSSTLLIPSTTTASAGTRSPGRITTTSPSRRSSSATSASTPSRSTRAVAGCSLASARMAAAARRRERASIVLPASTSARMNTTASKYTSAGTPRVSNNRGATVTAAEYRNAAPVPAAISVFMSVVRCRAAAQALT